MSQGASFLGTGWSFPPRFAAQGAYVETVSDAQDIHQSLQILFSTGLGERIMREDFGCDLNSVLFEEIDQGLINRLTSLISDAILYHESRINLDRLEISESESEHGLLLIELDYTVRDTNTRYNMVYPFYLNEAVLPAGTEL